MLGKAFAWKHGQPKSPIVRLSLFFVVYPINRHAQKQMGFDGQNANWKDLIRKSVSFADQIEKLAPALACDGPNPEYPWPDGNPTIAPALYGYLRFGGKYKKKRQAESSLISRIAYSRQQKHIFKRPPFFFPAALFAISARE